VPVAAPALSFSIVYADADLLVVEKAAGMVVHPAHANPSGTLWDELRAYFAAAGSLATPGLVHRLDRETSGLLVVARTPAAHRHLQRQFERRRVDKGYLALVDGRPALAPYAWGSIEAPLGRDPRDRRRVRVVPVEEQASGGAAARTDYRVLRRFAGHALLRLWPRTGRTHQLRVHLAHIGLPIDGDSAYNPGGAACGPRLFLHADYLGFTLPGGAYRAFRAALPADLKAALVRLAATHL
jgi:23S rRNA pseudouridine1911/1915/1917 synthase